MIEQEINNIQVRLHIMETKMDAIINILGYMAGEDHIKRMKDNSVGYQDAKMKSSDSHEDSMK